VQPLLVPHRGHLAQHASLVVVRDDRDAVRGPELVDQRVQGVLHEVQLVRLGHGSGDIHHESERRIRARARVLGPGLQTHPQQPEVSVTAVGQAVRAG
jgi:hypothetical protein